jgi:hypothetical protein
MVSFLVLEEADRVLAGLMEGHQVQGASEAMVLPIVQAISRGWI